jgi:predicted transcriptional regulator of viral defense system
MRSVDAYADLRRFGKPVVTTDEAAIRLRAKRAATSRLLKRLADAGLIERLRHGLWSLEAGIDPLALPPYLAAPFPAYVSFQSALHLHGMLSQVPRAVYVASLGRTERVTTAVATYSIHRLAPRFFGGYQTLGSGICIATPEKALADVLYLAAARSRLFAALPEIELPRGFDARRLRPWLAKLPRYRRSMIETRLAALLGEISPAARRSLPACP